MKLWNSRFGISSWIITSDVCGNKTVPNVSRRLNLSPRRLADLSEKNCANTPSAAASAENKKSGAHKQLLIRVWCVHKHQTKSGSAHTVQQTLAGSWGFIRATHVADALCSPSTAGLCGEGFSPANQVGRWRRGQGSCIYKSHLLCCNYHPLVLTTSAEESFPLFHQCVCTKSGH